MWTINLPDPESHLLLTPRWGELTAPLQWCLLVLVGLVPLVLATLLYRRELQPLRPRVAHVLLTLRLLAIGLVWFLLALQPVLVHTITEELPGYLLIAVDRSASMEVADTDLTRSESARRVLSGEGLALLPRLRETSPALDRLRQGCLGHRPGKHGPLAQTLPGGSHESTCSAGAVLERSGTQLRRRWV